MEGRPFVVAGEGSRNAGRTVSSACCCWNSATALLMGVYSDGFSVRRPICADRTPRTCWARSNWVAVISGWFEGVQCLFPAVGPALPAAAGGVQGGDGGIEDLHRACSLGKWPRALTAHPGLARPVRRPPLSSVKGSPARLQNRLGPTPLALRTRIWQAAKQL